MANPFPISAAQAAILGRPAPVATVGAPQGGQTPIPANIAALTGQTPIAGIAAPGGFQANPLADVLLGRANRQQPIGTATGLLGRLAALGVGTKLQKENEAGETEARAARLSALGVSPELAGAVANNEISLKDALSVGGKQVKTLTPAEAEAAGFRKGDIVQQDPTTGKFTVARSSDLKTPARVAQDEQIAVAGATNVDVNTGNLGDLQAIAKALEDNLITPDEAATLRAQALESPEDRAQGGVTGRATGTLKTALPKFEAAEKELLAAAQGDPLDTADLARYKAAVKNYVGPFAQIRFPGEAVTQDVTRDIEQALPSSLGALSVSRRFGDTDPLEAVMQSNRTAVDAQIQSAGLQGGASDKPISEMTDAELEELAR